MKHCIAIIVAVAMGCSFHKDNPWHVVLIPASRADWLGSEIEPHDRLRVYFREESFYAGDFPASLGNFAKIYADELNAENCTPGDKEKLDAARRQALLIMREEVKK